MWPAIALAAIVFPPERLQVDQFISAAQVDWLDVIYLPAVLSCLPVFTPLDPRAAGVFAPDVGVIARNEMPLIPNCIDSSFTKTSAASIGIWLSKVAKHCDYLPLTDCSYALAMASSRIHATCAVENPLISVDCGQKKVNPKIMGSFGLQTCFQEYFSASFGLLRHLATFERSRPQFQSTLPLQPNLQKLAST